MMLCNKTNTGCRTSFSSTFPNDRKELAHVPSVW